MQEHNTKIACWLEEHRGETQSGAIKVFVEDECHVSGGDICGYGWGQRLNRREVDVNNYRTSRSYFGALDCLTHRLEWQECEVANTQSTIKFMDFLRQKYPNSKLVLIWDGASYHRSREWRQYLEQVNGGLEEKDWVVQCLRFAPYAPSENPMENIWGQGKQCLRKMFKACTTMRVTQALFEAFMTHRLFTPPNLETYGAFSGII